MIHVFIEANVLIIRHQTVNATPLNVNDIIDKRTSTGQMIDPLVTLLIQNLHVLLPIRQNPHIRRSLQLEDLLSLHIQLIQLRCRHKLKLLLVDAALLTIY